MHFWSAIALTCDLSIQSEIDILKLQRAFGHLTFMNIDWSYGTIHALLTFEKSFS